MTLLITSTPTTAKPRTKRTRKVAGFHLSGAQGKHARSDSYPGSRFVRDYDYARHPNRLEAIAYSLDADDPSTEETLIRAVDSKKRRAVYTQQSPGFALVPPKRNLVALAAAKIQEERTRRQPEFDEFGRRIVRVSDCDAWRLRVRR